MKRTSKYPWSLGVCFIVALPIRLVPLALSEMLLLVLS
jgi:hypothetical protein